MGALILLLGAALAREPVPRPATVAWEPGRLEDVLIVKFRDDLDPRWADGWRGLGDARGLDALVAGARVTPRLPDAPAGPLRRYFRVETPDAAALGARLLADPRVETAYLAFAPAPPPTDIPPATPDFTGEQGWLGADGYLFGEAARHRGGDGAGVVVFDVEYGWDLTHEDLDHLVDVAAWGHLTGSYVFHGNAVLGQLVGGDNGYGVTGGAPGALVGMLSPFVDAATYDVAAAIVAATALAEPGDVLLIEQQAWVAGTYGPVEADPAVFDAIRAATDAGVVVVEPGGNGALDLDDPALGGWFDRAVRDSGAILVGGGASPDSGFPPRSWYPWGSSYGSRVDVQGWYDSVVTASWGDYGGAYADLWYPDDDPRQAYTANFGGTSGASPMVAAAAAVVQAVALARDGAPWSPEAVRAAMVATGTPQPADDPQRIGPQPDLRRLLRTYLPP